MLMIKTLIIFVFFSDDMGCNSMGLNNINLDDDNFDEHDPETINQVRPRTSCNRYKDTIQCQVFKKDISKELMPVT